MDSLQIKQNREPKTKPHKQCHWTDDKGGIIRHQGKVGLLVSDEGTRAIHMGETELEFPMPQFVRKSVPSGSNPSVGQQISNTCRVNIGTQLPQTTRMFKTRSKVKYKW